VWSKGNSMNYEVGSQFTTKDQDNDPNQNHNCAIMFTGAWWFKGCYHSHLNAVYNRPGKGMQWLTWKGKKLLNFSEMKLRPEES